MRLRRLLPLLALFLAPPAPAACPPVATVPLVDGPGGTVLVEADIAGHRLPLMLDTGAGIGALREGAVEALGLPRFPLPFNSGTGIAGRPILERTRVDRLDLGPLRLDRLDMVIEPRTHAQGSAVEGVLGADLFARYDLELDFRGRTARFLPAGVCGAPAGTVALPLEVTPSGHIRVAVELDGRRVAALIDTGAQASVMTLDTAHDLYGIRPASLAVAGTVSGADGGAVNAYLYPFRSLSLGSASLDHPPIVLIPDETRRLHVISPDGSDRTAAGPEGFPDLILGIDQLRRFRLTIGYRDRTLWVASGG